MSWLTIAWSMIASVSLTLAAMYFLIWYGNRARMAHLLFSLTALTTAAFTFCELAMLRAQTPAEMVARVWWAQFLVFFWIVFITWFVKIYLRAGRTWLAWTICGLRTVYLVLLSWRGQSLNYREMPDLRQFRFLGEAVSIFSGRPHPITLIGQVAVLMLLVFVADATVSAWRQNNRRRALTIGATTEFFLLLALGNIIAVDWGRVAMPIVYGLPYLGIVIVMGYELSRDALRAFQLGLELEGRNRQISDLFGRLIMAQETERSRLARDLHDDVSQRVAGLSLMMSSFTRRLRGNADEAALVPALASIQQQTFALAEQIRHVSHDLHPVLLQQVGLDAALRAHCAEFAARHSVSVKYRGETGIGNVETDTSLCLYRIVQEALRNVAKHANASHVEVTLSRTPGGVQLSILDDGRGFDISTSQKTNRSGLGLVSIDERARLLRGSVQIAAGPRGGTRIQVEIPHAVSRVDQSSRDGSPVRAAGAEGTS